MSDEPKESRETIGRDLRALRKRVGITGIILSARTGISQSKISKIESGILAPTGSDISAICSALGATAREKQFLRRLDDLLTQVSPFHVAHRVGLASRQRQIGALERAASSIRVFQLVAIPGVLQTLEYAHAILAATAPQHSAESLVAAASARMARQSSLYDPNRQWQFVIHEQALLSTFASEGVMTNQVAHLDGLSILPNVAIRYLSARAIVPVVPQNSFSIYDDQLVSVETFTAVVQITDTRDREVYETAFAALWNAGRESWKASQP